MYIVCANEGKITKLAYGNREELKALYLNNKTLFDVMYDKIWLDRAKRDDVIPDVVEVLKEPKM